MKCAARTAAVTAAILATLLAGCASPEGLGPIRPLPAAEQVGLAPTPAAVDWPAPDWWSTWHDPVLDRLVAEALATAPTLQAVQSRVALAASALGAAQAAGQPQVRLDAHATDQRYTEHGLVPAPVAGSVRWSAEALLGASWEVDLFGRRRALVDSAVGRLRAAEADQQAARVLLAGNVVSAYLTLARHIQTQALLQQAVQQREQTLALVRERARAGLDSAVEVRQAEGLVAQTRVELEVIGEAAERTRHALAELAGRPPQALADLSPRLPAGAALAAPEALPVDLLGRRADLVALRWRVEAAAGEVAASRAAFYPSLDLTAFAGLSSLGLEPLLKSGSLTWGLGPALHLPIFDAGRLRADLAGRSALADAAVSDYHAAVLAALREVGDEVSSLRRLERQAAAQADASHAAEAAHDLALQRYRAGLGTWLTVLNADSNVIAQRRAVVDLTARQRIAQAALARALGGGYDAGSARPPALATAEGAPAQPIVR